MDLQKQYKDQILKTMKESFNLKNDFSAPYLEKIVINAGVADAISDKSVLDKIKSQLAQISGQQPKTTLAKKSISSFKLRLNDPIGVVVTLRNKKAWDFLERFIAIVMPRMRDFRGLPTDKFDKSGNYSLGIPEQILFPEIDYAKVDKIRGLVLTLVIKNSDPEKSKKLMELLGMKFKNA
ncbi:50S ribosomal protein L5 [Candidatus Curtissbacteria bacterium]|nr:50S ribosomal protein L5 [Candidatus Curtissbacteria bacterium]